MSIEDLNGLEILEGILTSIFVIISILVGLGILLRYFKYKKKELITVGASWLCISTPWWGNTFSFLLYIIADVTLPQFTYLFIENVFIPIALVVWIYSFTYLAYPHLTKKLTIVFSIVCGAYDLFVIIALVVKPELIGTLEGRFDSNHTIIPNAFRIFAIIVVLITGSIFALKSMKSRTKIISLKGKFLLLGFISFLLGALLDAFLSFAPLELIIVRALLISSAIEYYLGFYMPQKIANLFIREKV